MACRGSGRWSGRAVASYAVSARFVPQRYRYILSRLCSTHMEHTHVGSCSQQGPIVYSLNLLRAGVDGTATATTVIPGVLGIAESGWYVNIHAGATPANGGLAPVACGNVGFHNGSAMAFFPSVVTIHEGDTVTWLQPAGKEAHTVTILAPGQKPPANPVVQAKPSGGHVVNGPGYYNSGLLFPGQTYSLTFKKPRIYPYRCLLHDDLGMLGKVIVFAK
jgi:plastocyanin